MAKQEKFEDKIKALEKIINDLENGNSSLDESIDKYREAMKLIKDCDKKLKSVEAEITKLVTENDEVQDFNIEE